jgi:hypothetical protein
LRYAIALLKHPRYQCTQKRTSVRVFNLFNPHLNPTFTSSKKLENSKHTYFNSLAKKRKQRSFGKYYWNEITNYCKENAGNITPEISAKLNFYSWEALNLIDGFTPFDEDKVIKENLIPQKIPYTNALFNILNGSTSQLIKSLSDVEFSSKLSKITKPVIAMSGNYDFVVPEESAVEFINKVGSLKKSKKLFMKSGHNLEEQEAYVDAFIQFIDENK